VLPLCRRCGLGLPAGKCTFKNARLYLSTVRMVVVCRRDNPLHAFDMPLVRVQLCAPRR
jgi:hypothetical protein